MNINLEAHHKAASDVARFYHARPEEKILGYHEITQNMAAALGCVVSKALFDFESIEKNKAARTKGWGVGGFYGVLDHVTYLSKSRRAFGVISHTYSSQRDINDFAQSILGALSVVRIPGRSWWYSACTPILICRIGESPEGWPIYGGKK